MSRDLTIETHEFDALLDKCDRVALREYVRHFRHRFFTDLALETLRLTQARALSHRDVCTRRWHLSVEALNRLAVPPATPFTPPELRQRERDYRRLMDANEEAGIALRRAEAEYEVASQQFRAATSTDARVASA